MNRPFTHICMRYFYTLLLFLAFIPALADDVKIVEGEYTYHAPENVTIEEAKRTAIDRAKIQALADAFGTTVSQHNSTIVDNRNGSSSINFHSIGGSDVKGEWLETIGEPAISISYEKDMLVVKVSIKGRAREIKTASIDLHTAILRNGTDEKYVSTEFKDGDDMYLSFLSPVNGYLSVYLVDAEHNAYCLLPYRAQQEGIYRVEANRHYLFFKETLAPKEERAMVDEYTMTCSHVSEHNDIYVLFSPNPYTKAADSSSSALLPRELPFEMFQKWLLNIRKRDHNFQCRTYSIHISK